jgi:alpha-1,2-mannosyltransferase
VVSLAFMVPFELWMHWMYGTWKPTASYDMSVFANYAQSHRGSISNQLAMWVSPDRGIFVWTPVVLLLLPALARSWRTLPDWSQSLVVSGLAYTVLQAVLNPFSGGDTFYGYRYGLEFLACATPALALSTVRMGGIATHLLGPVIGVQALAISMGAVTNNYFLPNDQAWHRNAFVVAIDGYGVSGWVLVAMAALLGWAGQVLWVRMEHRLSGSRPAPVGGSVTAGA